VKKATGAYPDKHKSKSIDLICESRQIARWISPKENYQNDIENVKKYHLLIVDNWAPWCPPCAMLAPVIDSLAKKYAGKIVFGKLNVDENTLTSGKYNIKGIPTLLLFKDGVIKEQIRREHQQKYNLKDD
jgi:thioredoxin 1